MLRNVQPTYNFGKTKHRKYVSTLAICAVILGWSTKGEKKSADKILNYKVPGVCVIVFPLLALFNITAKFNNI